MTNPAKHILNLKYVGWDQIYDTNGVQTSHVHSCCLVLYVYTIKSLHSPQKTRT